MNSLVVHYKNKYPGAIVDHSDHGLDVYVGDEHKLSLRKNGANQMVCVSEAMGCTDRHDLSPIPKDARVFKCVNGKLAVDEKHEERKAAREQFMKDGKVQSCEELEKQGWSFDKERQTVQSKPAAAIQAPK